MRSTSIVSRRELLALASLAAAGGLLSACGASASPSPGSAAGSQGSPAAGSASPAAGSAKPAASGAASAKPAASGAASASAKPAASAAASASAKPAASPAAGTSASSGAQGTLSLKVAYPVITGAQTPLWLAESLDLFSKQKLKESSQLIATTTAVKALVAKEVDGLLQAAAAVITADLNGGTDLVYVGSEYNHSQEALMVASSIKTAADLKGKVWGTDQPGSTGDYQTKLLMRLLNINPNEVELRVLGTQDILFQALQSGQIQAAPISPPAAFQAEAAGLRVLRDTYDQPYQNVGLVVSKARIPELMPSLIAFLTGYRQGMMAYTQQPDAAKKVLQDKAKITDEATLQRTYDFYVKQTPFQLDLQPTTDGIQHMLDFVSDTIPAAKTATPEQFIDRRVLDQMPKA